MLCANHEAPRPVEPLLLAFPPQVAVVLLVAAVELEYLYGILGYALRGEVVDLIKERAAQPLAGDLELFHLGYFPGLRHFLGGLSRAIALYCFLHARHPLHCDGL